MTPLREFQRLETRRQFFGHTGLRLGGLALGWLMADRAATLPVLAQPGAAHARVHPPLPGLPHFAPKAKSGI